MKAYTERVFGNHEGKDVLAYRFETDGGYQLEVMTYGATILRFEEGCCFFACMHDFTIAKAFNVFDVYWNFHFQDIDVKAWI